MRINVLTELRQPVGALSEFDITEPVPGARDFDVRNLRGAATLMRTDRGLLVRFTGTVQEDVICSRCLKETECSLAINFEEEYFPYTDPVSGARIRSGFEPDAFRIAEDYTLDLREGVRQYLLISESVKPLCKPDCAGLCQHCGVDLNESACTAHPTDEKANRDVSDAEIR